MDGTNDVACLWRLAGSIGELASTVVAGRVDVDRPNRGLHKLRISDRDHSGQLLCVERDADPDVSRSLHSRKPSPWPLALKDAYVRATDLVAGYNATDDWPYSPQIYWSAGPLYSIDGVLGSLSMIVSVQTHLLDTWPRIAASSQLACKEILRVKASGGRDAISEPLAPNDAIASSTEPCCIVRRLSDAPISYAEIMLASDFRDVIYMRGGAGECGLNWTLFSEFMEKGVIRRARLVSAFLPRENDLKLTAACCKYVEHSPPPLTT